jgi:hypothetical protein
VFAQAYQGAIAAGVATVTGAGQRAVAGHAVFTLPAVDVTAQVTSGASGIASFSLPSVGITASTGGSAILDIPFGLSISGEFGSVGVAALDIGPVDLTGAILSEGLGTASFSLPAVSLSAAGAAQQLAVFTASLGALQLTASGVSGSVGTASFDMPAVLLGASHYVESTGTFVEDLPPVGLYATLISPLASEYRAWSLNVRNAALTEYLNMEFNSLAHFNGHVLACGAAGICVLGEADTDAGTAIAARVRTAAQDFGTSYNKRVPRAYLGGMFSEDMEFHTITSQDGTRAYLIPRNGNTAIQQRRVPIGRGPKARYWQFEIRNRNGGAFLIDDLLVYPEVSNRRVI